MNSVAAAPAIPRAVVADRGTWAMALFIATEATLFVCLFFSYFYLGRSEPAWPPAPPEWTFAVVMLVVLLTSSGTLHWAERRAREGFVGRARIAVWTTVVLGLVFMGLQTIEYRHHLEKLRPTTNAYGSIFYTITGIHGAHVILGLLMLIFVLLLPEFGEASKPPHRALHNAALYWHFVDVVWIVIVAILYLEPNLRL